MLSILYTALYFIHPTFLHPPPPSLTTLLLLAIFILDSQSLFLGIIGEYVGRIYNQGKKRPLYVVSRRVGQFGDISSSDRLA